MIDFSKYVIPSTTTVKEALIRLNNISDDLLTLLIVDENNIFLGSLTDGDIRRSLINGIQLEDEVKNALHKNFFYINIVTKAIISIILLYLIFHRFGVFLESH